MNLFQNAPVAKTTSKAKAEKPEVRINEPEFHEAVYRLAEIAIEKDALEAEEKSLGDDVKTRSIEEFVKLYEKTGTYPGSFNVFATGGHEYDKKGKPVRDLEEAGFMCLPTDKYITINEESYEFLSKKFGDNIVEKTDTYFMNTELVEKYGDVISKLIMNCKEINDTDKLLLISKKTTYSVRKGTIQSLKSFKASIGELVSNILPVFQRKNVRIVN